MASPQYDYRSALGKLWQPTDIASLVFFRVAFGLVMIWHAWRYFESDWIFEYFIGPKLHFKYYGFGWVKAWPGIGMYYHFLLMGLCAICVAAGFAYRVSTVLLFLLFTYAFLLDQALYLNHYYLVSLISLLMIFLPAHRSLSVDAWLRPSLRSEVAPGWCVFLLRAQLGIVYFYAGVAKLNADWLAGEPARAWLAERQDYTLLGPLLPVGTLFTEEWFVYGFAYGGLLFDLLIVPLLWCGATRLLAYVWCLAFHLMNAWLFDIGIFPWFMLVATLVFFPPDWPRRIFNWPRKEMGAAGVMVGSGWRRRLTASCLIGYLSLQVLIPLRHFVYPGQVHWTEEGHRFAWHMKLRDKSSTGEITASDPRSGQSWAIDMDQYLTSRQQRKALSRPDMLLQFCQYVAADFRRKGYGDVQVRARVNCSLNGRPPQPLIFEEVDIAAQPRSLLPASWIQPFGAAANQSVDGSLR